MTGIHWIFRPLSHLTDPSQRVFVGYLVTSALMALLFGLWKGRRGQKLVDTILAGKLWAHSSSQVDFKFFLLNSFLKSVIFFFVVDTSFDVSMSLVVFLQKVFPLWEPFRLSHHQGYIVYGLGAFFLMDFFRFFQHYLFHRIPFLWSFHKVHHSAQVLTPLTLYRAHPVESLCSAFRKIAVVGLWMGFYSFFTGSIPGGYDILGVHLLDSLFNLFGANLRHSHIPLSFGSFNRFFISPVQHQWHHRRDVEGFGQNFGVILSLWDQFFGTFRACDKPVCYQSFGVRGQSSDVFWGSLFPGLIAVKKEQPTDNKTPSRHQPQPF